MVVAFDVVETLFPLAPVPIALDCAPARAHWCTR